MNKDQAIGIYDSGIGGLTVASAINQVMPNESMIYFGDTAHLPYGDKSAKLIKEYSIKITDFLLAQDVKLIIIACNSASSTAYETVKKRVAGKIEVFNVIDPVVEHISKQKKLKTVGIIGTKATIRASAYKKKIAISRPDVHVKSMATPLLAPMVEEGFFNNNISQTVINNYLSNKKLKGIESLVLACTHYPLIKKEIKNYYDDKVEIINSADVMAERVRAYLSKKKLLRTKARPKKQFFVSDYTSSFEKSTKIFFKGKIHLELKKL
ncbi:MAG: glutamate racemase [Bacteroidia bacterium]|nr:glutamate racemase [Bacteroidia bacterium]